MIERQEGRPAPAASESEAPPTGSARGDRTGTFTLGAAALAVVIAGGGWWQLSGDVADLRESQRLLLAELAGLRRSAVLDVSGAPARGSDDARVVMVEFSDYECPFCIRYTREILPELDAAYVATGRVRYVFRDFPIDELHPAAIRAHEAGRCATEQGRFWDLHYRLFSPPGTHGDADLEARAGEAGLSVADLRACLASGRAREAIAASVQEAVTLGATGTPSFFIGVNDPATRQLRLVRAVTGAQPFEVFKQALDAVLAQVEAR
jgi:protein-disulfide isomerase